MAKKKEWQPPETLGGDYAPYRLKRRFRFKRMDDEVVFLGQKVAVGDYIGFADDGGALILTEEELNEHYEPGS